MTATSPCTSTARMIAGPNTSAALGRLEWSPTKSLWIAGMLTAALTLAPIYITPGAVALFAITTIITLCAGHSIGMHRLLVHRSFKAKPWVEYLLVYLGTLVGMAGPSAWSASTTCATGPNANPTATTSSPTASPCSATPSCKCTPA